MAAPLTARNNNEANRRDRLFRDFMHMDAPVVPPALARASHWGFGPTLGHHGGLGMGMASGTVGQGSIWGNASGHGVGGTGIGMHNGSRTLPRTSSRTGPGGGHRSSAVRPSRRG